MAAASATEVEGTPWRAGLETPRSVAGTDLFRSCSRLAQCLTGAGHGSVRENDADHRTAQP